MMGVTWSAMPIDSVRQRPQSASMQNQSPAMSRPRTCSTLSSPSLDVDVPDDVLAVLFEALDPTSLCLSAAPVCKALRRAAREKLAEWRAQHRLLAALELSDLSLIHI